MYSYGPLHMAEQRQGDQLAPTFRSSVRIRGVALRTCRKRWTIGLGGERGSGISVLMARQDDDDDCSLFWFRRVFHTSYTSWFSLKSKWQQVSIYRILLDTSADFNRSTRLFPYSQVHPWTIPNGPSSWSLGSVESPLHCHYSVLEW